MVRHSAVMLGAIASLALPAAAAAGENGGGPGDLCRQERAAIGAKAFAELYGKGAKRRAAFGRCVSRQTSASKAERSNAAKQCKAEQADPLFPETHGGATFQKHYGTGKGANAFGK